MSEQIPAKIPYNCDNLTTKITELYETAIEEYIEEHNTEEAYEQSLNDNYPPVSVCGYERDQGTLLREIDPIAFRCGVSDNEDFVREQAEQEISEDDFRDEALELLNMEDEDI